MSQCVPNWDLDDTTNSCRLPFHPDPNAGPSAPDDPIFDYEVAELTWENGQLAMHGLGPPRPQAKPLSSSSSKYPWEKPRANGTLESIVDQATCLPPPKGDELVPWFDNHRSSPAAAAGTSAGAAVDALVPCSKSTTSASAAELSGPGRDSRVVGSSTRVGSCSGAVKQAAVRKRKRVVVGEGSSLEQSLSGSGSRQVTMETYDMDLEVGLTSTSHEQTSLRRAPLSSRTKPIAVDDHDSVCHSRPQRETGRGDEKNGRSSISTKRSRAAAIHNQSERKRRDRINQRMKTLQKLVPNSSKADKASMLDEVIEYLKQLQAQVQMMSKMSSIPHMMMPMAMQQLQMSMMAQMGMGMGMGMGVMDINSINWTGHAAPVLPPMLRPAAFLPLTGVAWDGSSGDRLQPPAGVLPDPFSAAFLACQTQQPMNLDAYNRMAAIYQQLQQSSGLSPPNSKT